MVTRCVLIKPEILTIKGFHEVEKHLKALKTIKNPLRYFFC